MMFNPFRRTYSQDELTWFRFLSKCPLLAALSPDELSYFLPFLYPRDYKQDEVVFFRNDPSQALYIIRTGVVSVSIDVGERLEPLTQKRAFQALGENACLPDTKRVYNAIVASESAEIIVIPQANLLEIFDRNEGIRAKVNQALATQFNQFMADLFYAYRSQEGFFELSQAYTIRGR